LQQTKLNFKVKVNSTPEGVPKRRSQIEIQHERTELKVLLREKFTIPGNNGTTP
jgi:hypothetical protein